MATFNEQLKALLKPTVEAMGYEFWGLVYQAQGNNSLLRVMIESSSGVTIGDCEKVSRQLASVLDAEDIMRHSYRLEVSSPGMDRLLFELDHFRRYMGQEVKIKLYEPLNEQKVFIGTVVEVSKEALIQLKVGGDILPFAWNKIQMAQLQPVIHFSSSKKL